MSGNKHQPEVDGKVAHTPGCLNRHVGNQPKRAVGNTCSHRWQAYEKMKAAPECKHYNWPAYKSLADKARAVDTAQTTAKSGKLHPSWYSRQIPAPKQGSWDVKGENFFGPCYTPYWHNAHHIVPNGTLRASISKAAGDLNMVVRKGLVDEGYNLNDKKNMIMLPMDRAVSAAIGLPLHLQTATAWAHKPYSNHVKIKLDKSLKMNAKELDDHEQPNYKKVRGAIEALSEEMHGQIIDCAAPSLDDMVAEESDESQPPPALT